MLAFDSYHFAMQAEKLLETAMRVRVMPTLRSVSESCGMSLRVAAADGERAAALLLASALPRDVWRRYSVFQGGSLAVPCEEASL